MNVGVIEKSCQAVTKLTCLKILGGMGYREHYVEVVIDAELRHEEHLVELKEAIVERLGKDIILWGGHKRNDGHRDQPSLLVDVHHKRKDILPSPKATAPAKVVDAGVAVAVRFQDGFDALMVMADDGAWHAGSLAGGPYANKEFRGQLTAATSRMDLWSEFRPMWCIGEERRQTPRSGRKAGEW